VEGYVLAVSFGWTLILGTVRVSYFPTISQIESFTEETGLICLGKEELVNVGAVATIE
jgi:hypothetical protein